MAKNIFKQAPISADLRLTGYYNTNRAPKRPALKPPVRVQNARLRSR